MDRIVKILKFLAAEKKVKISLLAEILGVSNVTLRKDLDALEKKGIIRRSHGFAGLEGADSTGRRIAFNYSIKRRIAKTAAEIVEDGETIILGSGSCCALFAEELAVSKKNITIITNSFFITNYVKKPQNLKFILLGGYLQPESQVLTGPITAKSAECVFSDKFFLGTDGFASNFGFTGGDRSCVEAAIEMVKRAKKAFVLTESAKFHRQGAYNMIKLEKITGVFTDDGIPKEAEAELIKNGVFVKKAPSVM